MSECPASPPAARATARQLPSSRVLYSAARGACSPCRWTIAPIDLHALRPLSIDTEQARRRRRARWRRAPSPRRSARARAAVAALGRMRMVLGVTAVVICLEIRDMVIFLAYPSTTATIFTTFVPRKFSCGEGCAAGFAGAGFTCGDDCTASFLAADLSVEFYQGWHRYAYGYAAAMIPVWPLGVPAYMLVMFLRNRRWIVALRDEQLRHEAAMVVEESTVVKKRRGSKTILRGIQGELQMRHAVTHDENVEEIKKGMRDRRWIEGRMGQYELRALWFDFVESVRKLLLTGLAVLFEQGTMGQLVVGVVISSTVLALTALLCPYKNRTGNDTLAIVCQGAVVANLALAILLRSSRETTAAELQRLDILKRGVEFEQAVTEAQAAREETFGLALVTIAIAPIVLAVVLALAQLGLFGSVRRRLSPLAAVLSDLPLLRSELRDIVRRRSSSLFARHTLEAALGESSAAEASVSRSTSLSGAAASAPRTFVSAKLLRARSAAKLPSEGTSGASQTMTPSQSHGAIPKGDAAAHAAAARAAAVVAAHAHAHAAAAHAHAAAAAGGTPTPTAPMRGDDEDGVTALSQCELAAVYAAVSSAPSRSPEVNPFKPKLELQRSGTMVASQAAQKSMDAIWEQVGALEAEGRFQEAAELQARGLEEAKALYDNTRAEVNETVAIYERDILRT